MSKIKFKGTMPACLTPFDANGKLLTKSVRDLVDWQLERGAAGFYVCGSTGEGPLISESLRREMVETMVDAVHGRAPIIVQVGSINSEEAFRLSKHATEAGADGISSVPPSFYFKYSLDETEDYYRRLADTTDLPLLIYAAPMMKDVDINALMARLLKVPNICGLKDTRGQYYAMWQLRQLNGGDINIINGPDEMLICGLTMGADGGIGSTYNVMPHVYANIYKCFTAGDIEGARKWQHTANRVVEILIKYGVIRALKGYLTVSGFDMGIPAYPQHPMSAEENAACKREIDAILAPTF